MTRIVAGHLGGRSVRVPPKGTRPTSDRVREALFSLLDSRGLLHGCAFLDLFSGSGACAFEALSRGASYAWAVEASKQASGIIAANARILREDKIHIFTEKVGSFLLRRAQGDAETAERATSGALPLFDVIFLDPPYDMPTQEVSYYLSLLYPWLSEDAMVLVERSTRSSEPIWPQFLEKEKEKKWGETRVYLARPREDN